MSKAGTKIIKSLSDLKKMLETGNFSGSKFTELSRGGVVMKTEIDEENKPHTVYKAGDEFKAKR